MGAARGFGSTSGEVEAVEAVGLAADACREEVVVCWVAVGDQGRGGAGEIEGEFCIVGQVAAGAGFSWIV